MQLKERFAIKLMSKCFRYSIVTSLPLTLLLLHIRLVDQPNCSNDISCVYFIRSTIIDLLPYLRLLDQTCVSSEFFNKLKSIAHHAKGLRAFLGDGH